MHYFFFILVKEQGKELLDYYFLFYYGNDLIYLSNNKILNIALQKKKRNESLHSISFENCELVDIVLRISFV